MSEDPRQPPRLPVIHDEAADTPNWVPLVGLALFVAVALWVGVRGAVEATAADEPPATVEPSLQAAEPTLEGGEADVDAEDPGPAAAPIRAENRLVPSPTIPTVRERPRR